MKVMKEFDKEQIDLVWESEEAWYRGFRGPGISGSICEKLLLSFLRKNIKELKFSSGVITRSYEKGKKLHKEELSPQIDIIAFKNEPLYQLEDFVIVHEKDVVCIIEVKKWVTRAGIFPPKEYYIKQIRRLKEKVKKPLIFVAFRHHKSLTYEEFKNSDPNSIFIFSKPTKGCPLEVLKSKEDFFEYIYSGELKQLVDTLRKFI